MFPIKILRRHPGGKRLYLAVIASVKWVAIACKGVAEINSLDKVGEPGEATHKSDVFGEGQGCATTTLSETSAERLIMPNKISRSVCLAVGALLFLTPCLFAGTSLQISNPPSNNVLDGIYVGSYTATNTSTGAQTQITCDDFKDVSDYNAATYTVNSFNNLGSTLWGSTLLKQHDTMAQITTLYEEAAWLTLGMLQLSGTQQGYYSFAIWAVFDPTEVASWLTLYGDSSACNTVFGNGSWGAGGCRTGNGGLEGLAAGQQFFAGEFSNFNILTPVCGGGPGTCAEQEFFQVVPEGGSALIYLLLAGVACFGAIFYTRRQSANSLA